MVKSRDIINITELPESARAELLDFYDFLKARHAKKQFEIKEPPLEKFVSNPIKVEKIKKYSRDEIHAR